MEDYFCDFESDHEPPLEICLQGEGLKPCTMNGVMSVLETAPENIFLIYSGNLFAVVI